MVPTTGTWLDAMIKAMSQVVIPALGARDVVAVEQANLVLQHLRLLRLQHPFILHYQALQAAEAATLASGLLGVLRECGGAGALAAEAEALLERHGHVATLQVPQLDALEDAAVELKDIANRIADHLRDHAPAQAARVNRLVLTWGEGTVMRERAWLNAADGNPDIPPLLALFGTLPPV